MIKLSYCPTYLIKIYCTERNILHSIFYKGHRETENFIYTTLCRQNKCVCATSVRMRVYVSRQSEWLHDMILSSAPWCSARDSGGSVDSILPLLSATFEFNHGGSAVVQITPGSSTPSHYQDRNWILEKPRGQARPANLPLICLWLVWHEPFSGMHSVVRRPCLT